MLSKIKSILKNTLAGQALVKLAIALILIMTISTAIAIIRISSLVKQNATETIEKYIRERGARESLIFIQAEKNYEAMIQRFNEERKRIDHEAIMSTKVLDKIIQKVSDGSYRNKSDFFNGKKDIGIFVPQQSKMSDELKKNILASYHVLQQFGLPLLPQFQNTYFTFVQDALVIYWPEDPNWIYKADKNFSLTNESLFKIGRPENNPEHKIEWTSVYLDQVAQKWMVSGTAPIYIQNEYIGNVHNDVLISEIVKRTLTNHLEDSENFLVDKEGHLIAHSQLMEKIIQSSGHLKIEDLKSSELSEVWQKIRRTQKMSGTFETVGENPNQNVLFKLLKLSWFDGSIVGYTQIEGPDWYLISSFPKSKILQESLRNVQFVFYSGIASLFIVILFMYFILILKVRNPLFKLIKAIKLVSLGKINKKKVSNEKVNKSYLQLFISKNENNEIGQLTNAFQEMIEAIQVRDVEIEKHTENLEQLVLQRTNELNQQRLISQHAAKMSSLGEMAGSMAHEINTPLAVVKLLCERSAIELTKSNPNLEKIVSSLKKIDLTTDRMAKIIQSMRLFSRDGSQDQFVDYTVDQLVEDTFQLCQEKLRIGNISFSFDIQPSHLKIKCQVVQMGQVLLNLINNSYDAIYNLEEKWIRLNAFVKNQNVVITLTDSGFGISEDLQQKIFNPFFTTKELGKGSGMGLSISMSIIKKHNGKFYVNTESDNTQFCIELPLP